MDPSAHSGAPEGAYQDVPLTVDVGDILPIIKQFMYSEREVFLRELLSNSVDALEKLSRSSVASQNQWITDSEPSHVRVTLDPVNLKLSVADNGIGMSRDEVIRYVNQIAFSGAREFISRYAEAKGGLIGRFGLGFYSSFMVSEKVEIDTLSARTGAGGCHWVCEGGTQTAIGPARRTTRGTTVTCSLLPDAKEFLRADRVEAIVRRYLDYVPYPIFLEGRQINMADAPWHRGSTAGKELPRERYLYFYHRLNPNENDPLGWFHAESDFPVQVRTLLFVPDRFSDRTGTIRLFANRTFVSDDTQSLLPEWLGFLDGVVDTPDLPINVSRDKFQSDRNVMVLRTFLTTKALSFLGELFTSRRADYVKLWERYGRHLKIGYLESTVVDEKASHADRLDRMLLFPTTREGLCSLSEYIERCPEGNQNTLVYTTDPQAQHVHLELLQNRNREVLLLEDETDPILVQTLSATHPDWKFVRVDEAGAAAGPGPASATPTKIVRDWEKLADLFRGICGGSVAKVSVEALPSREVPAVMNLSAAAAREDDLRRVFQAEKTDTKRTLTLNSNSRLIQRLADLCEHPALEELVHLLAMQIWDAVLLAGGSLESNEIRDVLQRHRDFLVFVADQLSASDTVKRS